MGHLSVYGLARVPRVACRHIRFDGRILLQLAPAVMVRRVCRWGFLATKIALVLAIVYFASLDLAYWHATRYSLASQYVQLVASFSICLFGMQWAVLDQRQRCPVCLGRVTNPAHVGFASRTFLGWNGTELMCADGHTLLQIPGLPTSWFSTQRWLYLDTSWEFLFAGSGAN